MDSNNRSNGTELGDIFRKYGRSYREANMLLLYKLKSMSAIEQCRTSALGGHADECDSCGHIRISYNSCRNRHCPKCQSFAKEEWIENRKKELLPITYFHIVFTIPDSLNRITLVNQKVIYDILLKSAKETLIELGKDPKHLGAEIGIIAILHTWGQNLMDHPHVHCIVTGGGLSKDGKEWLKPKKAKKKDFFIHVNIISDLFKKKFLAYLKKAYSNDELKLVGEIATLGNKENFQELIDELYDEKWITYCKKSFGGPEHIIEYFGRYTHRVAISNNRIIKIENGKVSFLWRDYRDGNKNKIMVLDVFEFIRRFLLHILPNGFFKIRYYGILSSRYKNEKLEKCREILDFDFNDLNIFEAESWKDLYFKLTGNDLRICPVCKKGNMIC
ncbi:IS91 family transposase, partial [candidate division KSB1 bacterium]